MKVAILAGGIGSRLGEETDLAALLRFHRSHGKLATLTAVRPPARFGHLAVPA